MLQVRPPVVTIMGHVDHGKTSILDRIRKSNLAAKEAGQITQAIGAYQATHKGKKITFIDTPGHEAFKKMRSRGANAADIAVLVVAGNDGVMPQTKESIKIIKEAEATHLVAVNKMDLPDVSIDKIKGQLAENEVFVEGYGGDVVVVPVSAKTGEGIDQLIEMILLTAEIMELKGDPEGTFEGIVIESKKDRFKGVVATVLVKNGTLRLGDNIFADGVGGKVKSMIDSFGQPVKETELSQPVELMGWEGLPAVGAKVVMAGGDVSYQSSAVSPQLPVNNQLTEGEEKKIKIVLKADTQGSLEAILAALPDEIMVLDKGVGEVTDSDVQLAKTFGGQVVTFNLRVSGSITKLAQTEKIKIKTYDIIYKLLKDLEELALRAMDPLVDKEITGKANIVAEFEIRGEKVAGAKVFSGTLNKADRVILQRDEKIIQEGTIKSMRHGKEEITQAPAGTELGVVFNGKFDFKQGDVIITHSL